MSEEFVAANAAVSEGVEATGGQGTQFTPKQQLALEALLAGKGVTRAAYAAGVTRQTVFRWRKEHPEFNAAITAAAEAALQSAQNLLLECAESAARAVFDAVENGDAYVALETLRAIGLIRRAADRPAVAGKSAIPAIPAELIPAPAAAQM
jgi:transposase-like protein